MTSQSPRIYLYKITFEEVSYYYYGVHKEKKFGEKYWGSPITHKWCWDFYTPKKQILEVFSFTDEGWLEAKKIEDRLIKPFYNTDKWCLNENCGGIVSLDVLRESGKRAYKKGLSKITTKQRSETGKKVAAKNKENKIGIFGMHYEKRKEIGKKSGEKTKKLGIGIHALTTEERRELGKKIGKKHYENKTGCFGITKEKRKEAIKKSHETAKKNKSGIYGLTKEKKTEIGKKAAKTLNSQKWMCLETGFITSSGPLTCYQKARGIDIYKIKQIL
jgi:ribosome recycling factor